jgi:hypothetical protein
VSNVVCAGAMISSSVAGSSSASVVSVVEHGGEDVGLLRLLGEADPRRLRNIVGARRYARTRVRRVSIDFHRPGQ